MFKYSVTESSQWNYCFMHTRTSLCKHDVIKVCSIEYLTTQIELVLPTFFQLLDRLQNYRIFNVRVLSSLWNIYHSTTAYFFDPPCTLWVKKQDTKLLPITSPNVNRFSKYFQWQTRWYICNKIVFKYPTTPFWLAVYSNLCDAFDAT